MDASTILIISIGVGFTVLLLGGILLYIVRRHYESGMNQYSESSEETNIPTKQKSLTNMTYVSSFIRETLEQDPEIDLWL